MTSKRPYDKQRYALWAAIPGNLDKHRARQTEYRRKRGMLSHKEAFEIKNRHLLHNPKAIEKSRNTTKAKKELHPNALFWSLLSPCGQVFKFRNLAAFVETNKHLFTPHQLEHVRNSKGRPRARVIGSLAELSPRRKRNCETIFGWRWHIDGKDNETLLSIMPAPIR
jgi:hypothetical protein